MRAHTQHDTSAASCTETCNDFSQWHVSDAVNDGKTLDDESNARVTSVSIVEHAYPCPHFFKDVNGFFRYREKKRDNL